MKKKAILVIGPVSPEASEIESIAKTLGFLESDYHIDYVDSLSIMAPVANEAYYGLWEKYLASVLHRYEVFMGFSFGGVILQQCFALFEAVKKSIVLFSTPSFADESLSLKLGKVVQLCQANALDEALNQLYQDVFLSDASSLSFPIVDRNKAAGRLIFGLNRVLHTDSRTLLKHSKVDHLHLTGERSQLVGQANVVAPKTGRLLVVPHAGMRVLQDNPAFCQSAISERLSRER